MDELKRNGDYEYRDYHKFKKCGKCELKWDMGATHHHSLQLRGSDLDSRSVAPPDAGHHREHPQGRICQLPARHEGRVTAWQGKKQARLCGRVAPDLTAIRF